MTAWLPPNLLAYFTPREPLKYAPPLDHLPWDTKAKPYTGVGQYAHLFEDPKDTPLPTRAENKVERRARKRQEKAEEEKTKISDATARWDPYSDDKTTEDAFKTLFVGRIGYDTTESTLRKEFEAYGAIKKIRMINNERSGKSRGYAFIEFDSERDMRAAYKYADGRKVDGRRLVVDAEKGRTTKGWKPRRLGGGLGGTRKGGKHENIRYSGRVDSREEGRDDRDRERERERDRGDRDYDRNRDRRGGMGDRYDSRDRQRDRGYRGDRSRDWERDRGRPMERSRDRYRERSRSRERDNRRRY